VFVDALHEFMVGLPKHAVVVSMTNDNLPSLYFYQRRGYVVSEWIPNGAAKLSASASRLGFGGIPIRDEVRLEKALET